MELAKYVYAPITSRAKTLTLTGTGTRISISRSGLARHDGVFAGALLAEPPSQKISITRAKKRMVTTLIILAAYPRAGVQASGEVSRMTPYTCQCCRMPDRANPMSPISQVKVTASRIRTYCDRGAIRPQRIAPVASAPRNMGRSIAMIRTMAVRTASTWYTENPIRTMDSTK